MKKISVITINYNTPDMTEKAVRNFFDMEKKLDFEFIMVDNGSEKKPDWRAMEELGVKKIENEKNLGFSGGVNAGLETADGEYILLMNSDVLIKENSISKLLSFMENNEKIGIAGPKLSYPDGKEQISAGKFPTFFSEFLRFSLLYKFIPGGTYSSDFKNISEKDWVSGGCMLIRKKVIDDIGGFDENYFFGAEDMDFCLRAKKAGWKTAYFPLAEVIHHHGYSSGGTRSDRRVKMERDGLDFFFKNNFPDKTFTRFVLREMHNFKIFIFNLIGFGK